MPVIVVVLVRLCRHKGKRPSPHHRLVRELDPIAHTRRHRWLRLGTTFSVGTTTTCILPVLVHQIWRGLEGLSP